MLGEINQRQKDKYYKFSFICGSKIEVFVCGGYKLNVEVAKSHKIMVDKEKLDLISFGITVKIQHIVFSGLSHGDSDLATLSLASQAFF